ncbi:GINS complex protein [Trypanosoma brucei equiperdum]|uniref:GINS complex protein n=1 Tax=Trypanosoma brucei equiperdum TaxID=630700 RepID=A0A3L6KY78_9TRYP|nr:GINS complex protein [Trypanosoma brucei equiperdum]
MSAGSAASHPVAIHAGNSRSGSFTMYHFASFAAMEVTVTIVPRFTMPRISTAFGGRYGPFTPNFPTDVPLWLALHIRQTDTCTIQPPPYVALPHLRQVLEREKENETTFEALPFYFFEVVKKLCEVSAAAEDVPHVAEVVRLVDEVRAVRRRKLQQSMSVFEAEGSPVFIPGIKLSNIVNHELQYLRTSFAIVLQQSADMKQRREQDIGGPIESVPTPIRTSGTTLSYTPLSTAAAAEARLLDYAGTRSSDTHDSLSTSAAAEQAIFTPENTFTTDGAPSVAGATETGTASMSEEISGPPVKKRRTLRQT